MNKTAHQPQSKKRTSHNQKIKQRTSHNQNAVGLGATHMLRTWNTPEAPEGAHSAAHHVNLRSISGILILLSAHGARPEGATIFWRGGGSKDSYIKCERKVGRPVCCEFFPEDVLIGTECTAMPLRHPRVWLTIKCANSARHGTQRAFLLSRASKENPFDFF